MARRDSIVRTVVYLKGMDDRLVKAFSLIDSAAAAQLMKPGSQLDIVRVQTASGRVLWWPFDAIVSREIYP